MSDYGFSGCKKALRLVGLAGVVAALMLHGFDVWGQDIERARQLFDEATTLRESGDYADALVRLKLAIAIKDTPGLEYHAGFCEAKLGHYSEAIEHFEQAASLIRAGANAPDVAGLLNDAHKSAAEHLAHVRVSLVELVPGATLQVDGEAERALANQELLLDPGKHHVRVQAPGYSTEERDIDLRDAEQMQLELRLVTNTHVHATPPTRSTGSHWRTASIGAALGVTALGLTAGIFSAVGHNNASVSERAASAGGAPQTARLAAARNDKQTYATWETVGFVTAGVGAVATVALWTLWPASQKNVSVAAEPDSAGSLAARLAFTSDF